MASISIDQFSGMQPLLDQRKLPNGGATTAIFTRLDGGDLRPFKSVALTAPDSSQPSNFNLTPGSRVDRLFRFTALDNVTHRWLAWSVSGARVDPVPSPIPADQFGRLYWTISSGAAQVASNPTVSTTLGTLAGARVLGVPAPINKPVVANVSSASAVSMQPISITKAKPAVVTFPTKSPFTDGMQVQIINSSATGTNMAEIAGKQYFVSLPASDTSGKTIELIGSDSTTYSALTDPSKVLVQAVFSDSDYESRSYVYTMVSDWGEEGPPSAPSDVVDTLQNSGTVSITINWVRPNGYDSINRARIYRAVAGTNGAAFFFAGQVTVTGGGPSTPATIPVFNDNLDPIQLGEQLPTTDWTPPVSGMFGLTAMPNGFMIGFKGNTVYACEPYEPHAWPDKYRKTLDYNVVGAATFGQSAVIATVGRPYIAVGTDSASLTTQQVDLDAPCISINGITSVGDGVAYPTYEGLAIVSASGSSIVTQNIMAKSDWLALWGGGMYGAFHENTYFALSPSPGTPSFALRLSGSNMQLFRLDGLVAATPATDTLDDSLNFVTRDGSGVFRQLSKWDAGNTNINYSWTSKLFTMAKPINFGWLQVFAASYPVTISVLGTDYSAGPDVLNNFFPFNSITSSDPVRMPSGFTAREYQVIISGSASIQRVVLAQTMKELQAS